jgi:hypothetical protein
VHVPAAKSIDGGIIDVVELAGLLRRVAAALPLALAEPEPLRGKQISAVVMIVEAIAHHLESPPLPDRLRQELARALAADAAPASETVLDAARALAAAERGRWPEPAWELFS